MINTISKKLAPTGVLRIGLNMSNFLLINGQDTSGLPDGVSPDIGKRLAKELNVKHELVLFAKPGLLADEVNNDKWDIGNIACEKERTKTIDFSNSYVNIDANFIFRSKDNFKTNEDVNIVGTKVAVLQRSAYDLWLTENFKNVELIRVNTIPSKIIVNAPSRTDILAYLIANL